MITVDADAPDTAVVVALPFDPGSAAGILGTAVGAAVVVVPFDPGATEGTLAGAPAKTGGLPDVEALATEPGVVAVNTGAVPLIGVAGFAVPLVATVPFPKKLNFHSRI